MTKTHRQRRTLIILAWTLMLISSLLPNILWFELANTVPSWLVWLKLGLLLTFMILSLIVKTLAPLFSWASVLFAYLSASVLMARFDFNLPFLQSWLGNSGFVQQLQPEQFRNLTVSAVILVVMIVLGYNRKQMFLVRGKLKAPITPVKWLGFPKPDTWLSFGGQYGLYLALGTGVALWLTSGMPLSQLRDVVPVLPAILVMATLNAFNEEFVYRAAPITTLETTIGRRHVWGLSAAFFGIAHYWGVPHGLVGVALSTFMGWMLAKAMLETRGFFWSWWIHFLQDVVIFTFIVTGSVTPGG
jgi:hypothetical protein